MKLVTIKANKILSNLESKKPDIDGSTNIDLNVKLSRNQAKTIHSKVKGRSLNLTLIDRHSLRASGRLYSLILCV